MKFPPYLKQGDTVAIMCPAGYMPVERVQSCIETYKRWGYDVIVGKTVGGNSSNYFSGTDDERKLELQQMLDDRKIKAIIFGRGGYGTGRIIDELNFKKFIKHPKWLVGFSDITILHTHIFSNYKIASLHAPMAAAFNNGGDIKKYVESIRDNLEGRKTLYCVEPHPANKTGDAKGILIGGNLALLAHVVGTESDFSTTNKILFIEDIGEYLYNADRMLYQLKRSKKLNKIKGLIFGGFTEMKDTERPFGKTMEEILISFSEVLGCPVCFNFPVSHGTENFALKIGGKYHLSIFESEVILREM